MVLLEKNKIPYMLPFLPKSQNGTCYVASLLMLDVYDSVPADCSVYTNYKFVIVCQSVFDSLAKQVALNLNQITYGLFQATVKMI